MSDILIKGMEMPKDGSWRSIRIYPDGTIGRPIGFGDYALVEGAKAVPVPKHGALMDRDDFFATCPELVNGYKPITDGLIVIPAEEGET